MTAKATSSIQVIARLSRLLDALAAHGEPVSLKTLASATGLHPSTAFRILASLIEHDLVERSANGRYRLGVKLLRLGHCVRGRLDLHSEFRPLLEPAGKLIGEAASPGERDGAEATTTAVPR
jgi:DNA-binding IclR family transcriptional regulator